MKRTLLALLALTAALGQNPAPQNPPDTVIRINVNLVQVDAVVHDDKDRPVTDLKAQDFEILQDGKPQAITNFAFVTLPAEQGATVSSNPPARPGPAANGKNMPAPPPTKLKANQVRRTVALVVDDLGLSFENIVRVRNSLKKFVDTQMEPGDLVAVIRTGAGMGALQQFTSDKRLLYAAIDKVKYNALGRVGVSSFAPLGGGNETGNTQFDESRQQIFSVGTLGAVRYVVDGLRELPGRKSLLLFSENMQLLYSDGNDPRTMQAVQSLTDAANRSSVVIYSIDPRGLQYYGLTAADNTRGMNPRQISEIPMQRSQQVFNSQDGLVLLAHDTGGLFLHDNNDLDGEVRKALVDSQGYYLIGYHPAASTFDEKTGQPKFHKVSIRMKRAGLHVRTRTGFYGTSDRLAQGVPHTRVAQLAHALNSPFSSGQIHVRLTTLFSNAAARGSFLNSMLYIDAKDLKFEEEPDDWHKAVIDIVAVTFGDNGEAVDTSDRTYTVRVHGDTFQQILKNGLVYSVHHPVKKAGAYQMRVALRDAGSEEVGSASQFLEVPDVAKGHLTLSSIVLQEDRPPVPAPPANAAPPPAGATGAAPPATTPAAPKPSGAGEKEGEAESDLGSPAIRIFKPGTPIIYGLQVLNAETDSNKQPNLELQTRLFRDGQQVYTGKPMPLAANGQTDPKRLIAGGAMRLGKGMTPGDYTLQVIVTDKLAKDKFQTASQWMDFEVQ
jgi:VWFA-related protein